MSKIIFIGEIGINHGGSLDEALQLIDVAKNAGASLVKFQKRNPTKCVPEQQKNIMKETPWGLMTYYEYKQRIEFGQEEYNAIDKKCKDVGIDWFASAWDLDSVLFLRQFSLKYNKIASALLTDNELLNEVASEKKHTFISTGMSDYDQINSAVKIFRKHKCPFTIFQCTSTYPSAMDEQNINVIKTFKTIYPDSRGVGFSNHGPGPLPCVLAVAAGANYIEAHITLRRNSWITDSSNSLEASGLQKMIRDCNNVEKMLGNGIKKVYDSEKPVRDKLRKI